MNQLSMLGDRNDYIVVEFEENQFAQGFESLTRLCDQRSTSPFLAFICSALQSLTRSPLRKGGKE
jgi:hypothetical protein